MNRMASDRMLSLRRRVRAVLRYRELYSILAPCLLFFLVFKYLPMTGLVMAFKNFTIPDGIWGSEWAGLKNFKEIFANEQFYQVFGNTLIISAMKMLVSFPAPILLAFALSEVRARRFKRMIQSISYFPNFLSWIVIYGMAVTLLSPDGGAVNGIITALGGEPVFFMGDNRYFRLILVLTDMWKYMGIESIVYLAALTTIDPSLYEAAEMDGAGRLQQHRYITFPCLASTIIMMLMVSLGKVLDVGHEQVIAFYNPLVYTTGDVISTYVFRMGIGMMKYSMAAAAGLFQSVVGFILVFTTNRISRRLGENGIW